MRRACGPDRRRRCGAAAAARPVAAQNSNHPATSLPSRLTLVLAQARLAVHLIRGHIDEPPDGARLARRLEQHVRAVGVVHGERQTVAEAVVDVRLGGGVAGAAGSRGRRRASGARTRMRPHMLTGGLPTNARAQAPWRRGPCPGACGRIKLRACRRGRRARRLRPRARATSGLHAAGPVPACSAACGPHAALPCWSHLARPCAPAPRSA
jgi:hypothetical protein